ncbi:MAG TPA: YibE/F family protein [Spirochaetia bacterium]|nr:YibE/F family protein [Spirochaetia bacterium]
MKKTIVSIFFIGLFIFSFYVHPTVFAETATDESNLISSDQNKVTDYQEETLEGKIIKLTGQRRITPSDDAKEQLYQQLEIKITKGSQKDKIINLESGDAYQTSNTLYKVGDKVIIAYAKDSTGGETYLISDYVRRTPLLVLFLLFVVVTIAIGKWKGLNSILGMGISFLVILKFILPGIYSGSDPVTIAILGSLVIIPVTFFLSHGFNRKTLVAILGTLVSLIITGILATLFVEAAKLTGFASEEAGFLNVFKGGTINIKGLLLAGMIIGVLGVLDDITVSQSAIVQELKIANPQLKSKDLYLKAMSVGKDHIASMVNTLILVYTGAALPLLLLFVDNPRPFSELINYEIIADEVVRTLVGSIGLVLAVPITTFIASYSINNHVKK